MKARNAQGKLICTNCEQSGVSSSCFFLTHTIFRSGEKEPDIASLKLSLESANSEIDAWKDIFRDHKPNPGKREREREIK